MKSFNSQARIKSKGFSLIETLVAISLSVPVMMFMINSYVDNIKMENASVYAVDLSNVINGVDQRISVDGYDFLKWDKTEWKNGEITELIEHQLQAINSSCGSGTWIPAFGDDDLKLISCGTLDSAPYNMDVTAALEKDSIGYIKKFKLKYKFKTDDDFDTYYYLFKKAFKEAKSNLGSNITGTSKFEMVNDKDDSVVRIKECMSLKSDCSFLAVLDRVGGSEYLRANGENSLIADHLTFIEAKGDSPLKCLRWVKALGFWTQKIDEECGIGIYNNSPLPIVVDVAADNGTYKNILLNKKCNVYSWSGTEIEQTSTSPCGMLDDGVTAYQVIENISSKDGYIEQVYSTEIKTKNLTVTNLLVENVSAKFVDIENRLNVNDINSYLGETIRLNAGVEIRDLLKIVNTGITEGMSCSQKNSSLTTSLNGELLNCINNEWVSLNKKSVPFGSMMMWNSKNLPIGWIEANGQSISQYKNLIDIYPSGKVPDLRGLFTRGWSHGTSTDSGRSLSSFQNDTDQRVTGWFVGDDRVSQDTGGAMSGSTSYTGEGASGGGWASRVDFDNAKVIRTGNESRPKNYSVMYIIKAY